MKGALFLVAGLMIMGVLAAPASAEQGVSPRRCVFEHIALDVRDPAATAKWWVENLGFEVTRTSKEPPFTTFLVDGSGRMAVELYRAPDRATAPDYAAKSSLELHLAFHAEDVDAEVKRLTAAGAKLEKREHAPGFEGAIIRDPSGIALQFVKRAKSVLK